MINNKVPLISIITASFNAKAGLKQTLQSVSDQSYALKQHIIVDGGSDDGTVDMLSNYHDKMSSTTHSKSIPYLKWISEADKGISDAFNKGIKLADGEYYFFLGAGDTFVDNEVLSKIFSRLTSRPKLICGKVLRVCEQGKPLWQAPKRWPKEFNKKSMLRKLTLPHQGLFMHKSFFEAFGEYDLSCEFAMDYEILLRAYHQFPKVKLIDEVVAHWQAGGVGQGRIMEIYDEYHRIKTKHQVSHPFHLWGIDRWNRIKYKIKSKVNL